MSQADNRASSETGWYACARSSPSATCFSSMSRYRAKSATDGARPSLCVSTRCACDISIFSSCNRRGTRTVQPRSRKCFFNSPRTVGPAKWENGPRRGSYPSTALMSPTAAT